MLLRKKNTSTKEKNKQTEKETKVVEKVKGDERETDDGSIIGFKKGESFLHSLKITRCGRQWY